MFSSLIRFIFSPITKTASECYGESIAEVVSFWKELTLIRFKENKQETEQKKQQIDQQIKQEQVEQINTANESDSTIDNQQPLSLNQTNLLIYSVVLFFWGVSLFYANQWVFGKILPFVFYILNLTPHISTFKQFILMFFISAGSILLIQVINLAFIIRYSLIASFITSLAVLFLSAGFFTVSVDAKTISPLTMILLPLIVVLLLIFAIMSFVGKSKITGFAILILTVLYIVFVIHYITSNGINIPLLITGGRGEKILGDIVGLTFVFIILVLIFWLSVAPFLTDEVTQKSNDSAVPLVYAVGMTALMMSGLLILLCIAMLFSFFRKKQQQQQ